MQTYSNLQRSGRGLPAEHGMLQRMVQTKGRGMAKLLPEPASALESAIAGCRRLTCQMCRIMLFEKQGASAAAEDRQLSTLRRCRPMQMTT